MFSVKVAWFCNEMDLAEGERMENVIERQRHLQ